MPQPDGSLGGQVGTGGIPMRLTTGAGPITLAWAVSACSEAKPITARARTRARTMFFTGEPFVSNTLKTFKLGSQASDYLPLMPQPDGSLGAQVGTGGIPARVTTAIVLVDLAWAVRA